MIGLLLLSLLGLNVANGEHDNVSSNASVEEFTQCMRRISLLEQMTSTKLQKQEETIQRLEEQIKDLTSQIKGKGQTRKRHVETPVAFTAIITQQRVTNIGQHQSIAFPNIITNIGASYHSSYGIFTVTRPGLYLISTTLLTDDSKSVNAALTVNGTEVVRLYEHGVSNDSGSTSQTIVYQLKAGDDVAVQSNSANLNVYGARYCSFTAVLLQDMDTTSVIVG